METRIVVIDNDESMRDLFTLALKREGWRVSGYAYAQVEIATLLQDRPGLIILDFTAQSGGTGWRFLQLLKMEDETAKIPILITTTAFNLSADIRGYLSSLEIGIIQKPFDLNTFLALVQKTITQASLAGIIVSGDRILPILVVDDMEDLNDTITLVLRLEGYQVVTASNGMQALDAVSRGDHSLILLDIDMPIMNGFEFLAAYDRLLKPHSPVIIVSGEADIWTLGLPSFVVDVLPKPFTITQLLQIVGKFTQPA